MQQLVPFYIIKKFGIRKFSSTPINKSEPDKVLKAVEELLNKQQIFKDNLESKSKILTELNLYRVNKEKESIKMREYMENMSFKYLPLDEAMKAKVERANAEYMELIRLYNEKLDKYSSSDSTNT
jgi:hypothetical protein